MENTNPTVSVCMITYGHELYIKEAIEGVLMQECDFEIELIIADDHSPDKTREIINDIIDNHPKGSLIRYTRHQENKGIMGNFTWALHQCTGKYIALCEGDDYWTDPLKLQKQVDFLEENEDFALCFHKVKIERNSILADDFMCKPDDITNIYDLAKGLYIRTLSVVFRNSILESFTEEQRANINGDYALFLMLSEYGKLKHFDEVMGVYRIHDGGVWSKVNDIERKSGFIQRFFGMYQSFSHNNNVQYILYENIRDNLFKLFDDLLDSKNEEQFTGLVEALMKINPELLTKLIFEYNKKNHTDLMNIKKSYRYRLGDVLLIPSRIIKHLKK